MKRHKTVRPITERLLRKVQKKIMEEPKQFFMAAYFTDRHVCGVEIPNCGTAACIAGWAVSIDYRMKPNRAYDTMCRRDKSGFEAGMKALRIKGSGQARCLFDVGWWDDQFRTAWNETSSDSFTARAVIACARIDHFINTGK